MYSRCFMPPTIDLTELERLRREASPLEPDAAARDALTEAALRRVRNALAREPKAAYAPDDGSDAALANLPIQAEPSDEGFDRALDFVERHVALRGHTSWAPGFFGYIPGGSIYHAALADYMVAALNPFTGHLFASPGGVRVENQVLSWLASLVGYPAGAAGNLTPGGSVANLTALITAREAGGVRARDVERTVVYMTEQAHHCVTKGLRVAGLGECVVRHIELDARYRLRPDRLEAAIAEDKRQGLRPWLVVGSAGTTDTGAVDPLEAIADVAARHALWFHVDAAYGGMFLLCDRGRRSLPGIERCDSIVLDPHKGLFIPFGVGAVLVKNRSAMMAAYDFDARYIADRIRSNEEVSPTEHSIELSRHFRGLRIWLPLQALGTAPFEAALDEKLLLARYAWERFRELDRVEVGPEPDLSIFVFRVLAGAGAADARADAADAATLAIENAFLADGRVLFSTTLIGGRRWLRMAVLAPATHRETIDSTVSLLAEKIAALPATS